MAINPIIAMTLGYLGVVVLAFFVINFLMAGFLKTFMQVKGSRGKKILTNVYAVNRNYAKAGFVDNGFYVYTDDNKHEKRLCIPNNLNIFYRFLNITWVNVDEETNNFISPDGSAINGFDAEKYNNLYKRTLYRPALDDTREQIKFILAIVTALLLIIILAVIFLVVVKKLDLLIANTQAIQSHFMAMGNNTII